jgi:hypothetical protein
VYELLLSVGGHALANGSPKHLTKAFPHRLTDLLTHGLAQPVAKRIRHSELDGLRNRGRPRYIVTAFTPFAGAGCGGRQPVFVLAS